MLQRLTSILWAGTVAACFVSGQALAAPEAFEGFDTYIEQSMTEWQVPGLAIVVLQRNEIIYAEAFGVRQVGKPEPVDLNTVFALSSTGKAYTATLAGTVIDEGKLDWDDPVSRHLDYFQLPDPWVTRQVTIRDLLSHRVAGDLGIGKLQLWAFTDLERNEVLRRLRHLQTGTARFRSQFEYSNPNISAAGQAAAHAAGASWDQLIQDRILDPLGMTRASITVRDLWEADDVAVCYMCDLDHQPSHTDAKIDNIAMPHISSENGPIPIPWRSVDNIAPAGSINSSVQDFARFVQLHLNKGEIDGLRVVSVATIEEMQKPQMLVGAAPYPAITGFSQIWTYGLGWFVTEYRGHKLVMHTGGITGWRSGMVMLPDEGLGVAIVSNSHGAHLPNTLVPALAFAVFDRVLGLPEVDHSAEWLVATKASLEQENAETKESTARDSSAVPSVPLARMAGRFLHAAFGELLIDPAAMQLRLAGVMSGTIEPLEGDHYRVTWVGPWPYRTDLEIYPSGVELDGFGRFAREED